MIEDYIQKAWNLLKEFRRITPLLIARKFKLRLEYAQKVCQHVWLRQHITARQAAVGLDNFGFPPQLQNVVKKNLERFKRKK